MSDFSLRQRAGFISTLFPLAVLWLGWTFLDRAGRSTVTLVLAAIALAVAGLVSVPSASGNRLHAGFAVAAGLAYIFNDGQAGRIDRASVAAAYSFGIVLLWLFRTVRRQHPLVVVTDLARSLLGFITFLFVLDAGYASSLIDLVPADFVDAVPVAVATLAWLVVDLAAWVFVAVSPRHLSRRYVLLLAWKDLNVFLSLVATGALFGLAYAEVGWWAVLVALLPYGFAHAAFRRHNATKQTYRQTIRALARIPEVAGLATDGHADRTASLAVAVADDLGLTPDEIDIVEYAALMHDIGRIGLTEPSVVRAGYTDSDIASWGAEIISESRYLEGVAEYVRLQHEPYRRPGEERDPHHPMAAKIIRACSSYDHAVHDDGSSHLEALEFLHRGAAYDFDPAVVAAVRRELDRRLSSVG